MLRPMSYPEIYMPDEEDYHPIAVGKTRFTDQLDDEAVATILDRVESSTAMMAVAQIRALGGAMARVPDDATAFAHRRSRLMVTIAHASTSRSTTRRRTKRGSTTSPGRSDLDGRGAYVNFLGEEGEAGIREAYPDPTWDRLRCDQAPLRPGQPLPTEPERPTGVRTARRRFAAPRPPGAPSPRGATRRSPAGSSGR